MIKLVDVVFSYEHGQTTLSPGKPVLNKLNLNVPENQFIALLGHNGCGKTTLAKLMNGLLLPSAGTVTVDGMSTLDPTTILKIRSLVGMVFQDPSRQMVASTIEDELAFGPENLGVAPEEILRRIDWALEILNIQHLRYSEPHYLSGGQTQRTAIAGVLVMQPKYIVMDEPTAMLDPQGRRSVLEAIAYLRQHLKISIIYVTHHMEEVLHADRVVVLNDGEIAADTDPFRLFSDSDLLTELGLEVPPLQLLFRLLKKETHLSEKSKQIRNFLELYLQNKS